LAPALTVGLHFFGEHGSCCRARDRGQRDDTALPVPEPDNHNPNAAALGALGGKTTARKLSAAKRKYISTESSQVSLGLTRLEHFPQENFSISHFPPSIVVAFWEIEVGMNPETKIYADPFDVDQQLATYGLTREPFDRAAAESLAAYNSCTPHHPPTIPASWAWGEGNRYLREGLTKFHWARKNEDNLPLAVNAQGTMAITFTSGDADTGIKEGFPCTRNPRGPRTADFVEANQTRFVFMEETAAVVTASMKVPGRDTWLFLVYRDYVRGEIRYELSRPNHMGEDRHVDGWIERIIFPPVKFDTNDAVRIGTDDGGQSPEISVEIRKVG